jgi:hypothetical protein
MKFTKKKFLGYSQLWDVIADKLDPYGLAVYRFLKSVQDINGKGKPIDFGKRTISAATHMGQSTAAAALEQLIKWGVLKVVGKGRFPNSVAYILDDDTIATERDKKLDYWKKRSKIWKYHRLPRKATL